MVWHHVKTFGWFDVAEAGTAQGIDVSDWQSKVEQPNWHAVAVAGFQFAYIKASQGVSFTYPTTSSQYQGARGEGLLTGFYHYGDPATDPRRNAHALALRLNQFETQLPPVLDLEVGTDDLSGWCRTFVDELRKQSGASRVVIYSYLSFFLEHIGESWMDPEIFLWLAHYGVPPGQPGYTSPRLIMHQFTQSGLVPGIRGNCDINVALKPLDEITGADLTPDEHNALMAVKDFLMTKVPMWDGGSQFPEGSGQPEELNVREMLQRANVETRQTWNAVKALPGTGSQPAEPARALTEDDVRRIVAEILAAYGIAPTKAQVDRAIERTQSIPKVS